MNTDSSFRTSLTLIQRAQQLEHAAWEQLVDLYSPLIFQWCRSCSLDPHRSADIVQEVLTATYRALPTFQTDHPETSFRGWLWTITRRKVIDDHRNRARQPLGQGGSTAQQRLAKQADRAGVPDSDPTSLDHWNSLLQRAVAQVQGDFEPRTWQAFWRTTLDGIPTAVVAEELGMTSAAVRQAKSRVLRRLRSHIGEPPRDPQP